MDARRLPGGFPWGLTFRSGSMVAEVPVWFRTANHGCLHRCKSGVSSSNLPKQIDQRCQSTLPLSAMSRRILLVAGARPNFVKIAPLMEQLGRQDHADVQTLLVHTGQHYDDALSHVFFQQLKIPQPDVNLEVGSGSHGRQTGEIMARFEPVVTDWKPDIVVVVGDVNSTLACALVASKLGVPVAHVEAGLRSFDRTMPEEINRVLTDAISDVLFVSEPSGITNLKKEGIDESKIHFVGNVMIDSLRRFVAVARQSAVLGDLGLLQESASGARPRSFALVTMHRPSNVDSKETLAALLEALNEIGKSLPVVFPAHPRTLDRIREFDLTSRMRTVAHGANSGVVLLEPVGYLEFLHLLSEASLVLTDSGGIQEETTALGVPCLTMRDNTERPVTVREGTNQLVGSDPNRILSAARAILEGKSKAGKTPEYWDGHTAERIVSILLRHVGS